MEGKTVIYIAGNPDLYPLEYYDAETESYQGVLPQLYAQFSAHSGYELIYYPTDGEDRREALAENRQVDILSGYAPGDEIPEGVQAETVLRVTGDGETDVYTLGFTSVAPEGLQEELTEYLQSVSQESISGLLLAQAQQMRSASVPLAVTASLGVLAALLAVTVMVLVRRYRTKLRLAYAALERDSLTGLGNGTYLERQYRRCVTGKNRILYQLIYFLVDIDRLRHMGTGQETEDFLQFAAHVLQENTSANDVLARVSDQGFAMLRLVHASGGADDWIQPLLGRLRNYAPEHGKPYNISVTAAIYPLQPTDTDPKEILSNANQIAHMAARDGHDYVLCTDRVLRRLGEEKLLQADLDRAFQEHEFRLYIQFYVDAQSHHVVGGEALSRWQHPRRGILTPGTFVPAMEKAKQISRLDYYSLREVCIFLEKLGYRGVQDFFLSCNFSRETFAAPDFVSRCMEIIDAYRFPRELLIFEITESDIDSDMSLIAQNIAALKAYGVSITLDDFGEGFTSFCDLQQYSVDGIKLDKSLVDNVLTCNGGAIVRAMIQVGHELGVTILAEGVETEEQAKALQEMHCDVIQGFHFHHPIPDWEARDRIVKQFANQSPARSSGALAGR